MRRVAIILGVLFAASCMQTQYVRPTESVTAESPSGQFPAAQYDLRVTDVRLGEAKLWSAGVTRERVDGRRQTVVRASFEIENTSGAPMEFNTAGLRLEAAKTRRGTLEPIAPESTAGPSTIAPGQVRRIDVAFPLPEGTAPRDVESFRVRWAVQARGQTYAQSTPFVEQPAYGGYYGSYPGYYGAYPGWGYPYYPVSPPIGGGPWFWP